MELARIKRLVALKNETKADEAALKLKKEEMAELEKELADYFVHEGVNSMAVDGKSLSLSRKVVANVLVGDQEEFFAIIVEAAKDAPELLGLIVTKRTLDKDALTEFVRAKDEAEEPLPPAMEGKVKIAELYTISTRTIAQKRSK